MTTSNTETTQTTNGTGDFFKEEIYMDTFKDEINELSVRYLNPPTILSICEQAGFTHFGYASAISGNFDKAHLPKLVCIVNGDKPEIAEDGSVTNAMYALKNGKEYLPLSSLLNQPNVTLRDISCDLKEPDNEDAYMLGFLKLTVDGYPMDFKIQLNSVAESVFALRGRIAGCETPVFDDIELMEPKVSSGWVKLKDLDLGSYTIKDFEFKVKSDTQKFDGLDLILDGVEKKVSAPGSVQRDYKENPRRWALIKRPDVVGTLVFSKKEPFGQGKVKCVCSVNLAKVV